MMMGLLLAGATCATGSFFADAAQAQQAQSQKGRPVAAAKPSVNRSKPNTSAAARPESARPAPSDRSGSANRSNANQSRDAQNRSAQNRNAQSTKDRNVNTANRQPRPGQPGYRGPDNVVVVNGTPGNGYYDNGRYYPNNNYNNYDRYEDDDDDFLEFVGKTAAITAGVSIVSAVIGDVVQDKPSDDCEQQIQNGQVYLLCNGTYYTPVQSGGQEAYQVVSPPQSSGPPPINR
ncbi:MAG: hypothetical protein ACK554_06695 [Erythrobacteraceae bacterium]